MERLTDRKTAADLKANADGLRAAGLEPSEIDKRYIKLAEYENEEEDFETFRKTHTATLYECDAENNTECRKTYSLTEEQKAARRAYQKKWRESNRDKVAAIQQRFYAKKAEKLAKEGD